MQYKTAHGIRSRRAPKCGVHTTVPAGYNALARVAATFASLARHLVSSPGAAVFRLALLSLLDADKDPIVAAFWQELDVEVGDKLRVAVGRAVIADQAESGAWLRRTLASLSEGIERRLTRASLQAGSSDWKKWALESLEKGPPGHTSSVELRSTCPPAPPRQGLSPVRSWHRMLHSIGRGFGGCTTLIVLKASSRPSQN